MEPDEFKKMVEDIRAAEKSIGKVSYSISENEAVSRSHRRSIFVVKDIKRVKLYRREHKDNKTGRRFGAKIL